VFPLNLYAHVRFLLCALARRENAKVRSAVIARSEATKQSSSLLAAWIASFALAMTGLDDWLFEI
jgi:hypothetical protein